MVLTRQQATMVAVMLAGVLLAVLNQTLLSPAFPAVMAEFGVGPTTVQWLTSGYSLVEAVVIPLAAYLMGRFTTRRIFLAGMACFTAGSLLAAWSPAFWVLMVGRVMQAVCTGMVMPLVTTVILLVFPRERRGSAMGLVGLVIGFAPAVGPVVAGLLIDTVGWHALFLMVSAAAAAVLVLGACFLRNYGAFERVSFDVPSVALCTVGLVCVLYGFSSFTSSGAPLLTAALVLLGICLLAVFVRRQVGLDVPMLKVGVLKVRRFAVAVAVIALMQACMIGLGVMLPLLIQGPLGQTATASGLVTLPGALLGAVMALAAGHLFDRHGARRLALPGTLVSLCGALVLCATGADTPLVAVAAAYALVAAGIQFVMTPLNSWGLNALDNSVVQHANSLSNTLNQVAGAFGTALIVSLADLARAVAPHAAVGELEILGDRMAFGAIAVLFALALAVVAVCVRGRGRESGGSAKPSLAKAGGVR